MKKKNRIIAIIMTILLILAIIIGIVAANKQKEITKTKTETKNHNYNNNYNKDRTPKVVTRYHNSFNEHFRKYSEDELEAKLLRVQNSKKAK